jgi:ankyrin repeat protein
LFFYHCTAHSHNSASDHFFQGGHIDAVRCLMRNGGDPTVCNSRGALVIDVCPKEIKDVFTEMLLQAVATSE